MAGTIALKLKPHVKKYVCKRYGESHTVNGHSFIGMLVLQILPEKIDKVTPTNPHEHSAHYRIRLTKAQVKRSGAMIGYNKRALLSRLMEKLFIEDMRMFVDMELAAGHNAMDSIKAFKRYYGLTEDDVKLETLYRNYQRYSDESIREKKAS